MRVTLHLVIPDRSRGRVLLVEDGDGWSLPRTSSSESTLVSEVGPTIVGRFGLDVVVLRDVLVGETDPSEGPVFLVTENLSDRDPTTGRWWDEDALETIGFSDPRDRAAALAWFGEVRVGGRPSLQPWQREEWFATASAWLRERVPGVTGITQFATWCISCVLRGEVGGRTLYMKASPTHFIGEGAVTATLGRLFPGDVPHVVALDQPRGWMVLEDLGGELVSSLDVDEWDRALDAVASLHRRSVPLIDQLLEEGCADRRPPVLAERIGSLAEDTTVALPDELRHRLHDKVERLQEMCIELDRSPIPSTLVHGDLHADNIMRTERGFVLFDWSDACVAPPLVDLLSFVDNFGPASNDAAVRRRLRDRYLAAWSDVLPIEVAIEWFELAEPLAAMHQAVSYRGIFDAFGPGEWWQFSSALPWWIERALDSPRLN